VISEEPIECGPRFFAPTALSGHGISLQAGRDDGTCFDRLLIKASLLGFRGIEALRANWYEVSVRLAPLNGTEPIQGLEAGRFHFTICAARARTQQGLTQSGIRIRKTILEPLPAN